MNAGVKSGELTSEDVIGLRPLFQTWISPRLLSLGQLLACPGVRSFSFLLIFFRGGGGSYILLLDLGDDTANVLKTGETDGVIFLKLRVLLCR